MDGTQLKNLSGTAAVLRTDLSVWDGENLHLGRVDVEGNVYNIKNSKVGHVDLSNGFVFNHENRHVATVEARTGFLHDYSGRTIGDVDGPHIMLGGGALALLVL